MTQHLGDFAEDATVDFKWSTNGANGASITRATNGTVSVYIGNGTTQLTAGVTDTEDFDGLTGIHHCRIDLSADAGYAPGSECQVVLSAATIDGQTVNAVLAHFSIERAGGALALLKGANGVAAIKAETASIQSDTNDLQTTVADLPTNAELATALAAADDAVLAAIDALPTAAENADAVWDEQVDGTTTARQSMRLQNSAAAGKVSGAATTEVTIRDLADTKDRIVATVDGDGNRTAITRDVT
jgi:hypothetical protein